MTVLCGYAGEDPHGKYVYSYADEFMKEHPNIKVEIQAISTNDIYTKLSAMATTPMISHRFSLHLRMPWQHCMIWD